MAPRVTLVTKAWLSVNVIQPMIRQQLHRSGCLAVKGGLWATTQMTGSTQDTDGNHFDDLYATVSAMLVCKTAQLSNTVNVSLHQFLCALQQAQVRQMVRNTISPPPRSLHCVHTYQSWLNASPLAFSLLHVHACLFLGHEMRRIRSWDSGSAGER